MPLSPKKPPDHMYQKKAFTHARSNISAIRTACSNASGHWHTKPATRHLYCPTSKFACCNSHRQNKPRCKPVIPCGNFFLTPLAEHFSDLKDRWAMFSQFVLAPNIRIKQYFPFWLTKDFCFHWAHLRTPALSFNRCAGKLPTWLCLPHWPTAKATTLKPKPTDLWAWTPHNTKRPLMLHVLGRWTKSN